MNIAYLKATKGRLEVQRDKLREVRNKLAEEQAALDGILLDLDRTVTEAEIRAEASK